MHKQIRASLVIALAAVMIAAGVYGVQPARAFLTAEIVDYGVSATSCTPGEDRTVYSTAHQDGFTPKAMTIYLEGDDTIVSYGPTMSVVIINPGTTSVVPNGTQPGDIFTATIVVSSEILGAGTVYDTVTFSWRCDSTELLGEDGVVNGVAPDGSRPQAGLWLADVCEPEDGFSGDGWMTWGSNAPSLPYGSVLFAAASPDGPWAETAFAAPPYIMNAGHFDAILAATGAADYHDVWLRAGTNGKPVLVGSAIIGREYRMAALCGE